MNVSYSEIDGKPYLLYHDHVNLGLAVDFRARRQRVLVVPNIKRADKMDFKSFWLAYEDLILAPGTTISRPMTSPGPRSGSRIPERSGPSSRYLASCPTRVSSSASGRSPIRPSTRPRTPNIWLGRGSAECSPSPRPTTIVSSRVHVGRTPPTYSPTLARRGRLLRRHLPGARDPLYAGALGHRRQSSVGSPEWAEKQANVFRLLNAYRVRGHLIADLDPLRQQLPQMYQELDPLH